MSVVAWVTLVILAFSILFAAGVLGAVRICLELALGEETAKPDARGQAHKPLRKVQQPRSDH
jgi:hypothetical protein